MITEKDIEYLKKEIEPSFWKFVEKTEWREHTNQSSDFIIPRVAPFFSLKEIDIFEKRTLWLRNYLRIHIAEVFNKSTNISNDGWWDFRCHIVGCGEEFFYETIQDQDKMVQMFDDRDYVENFQYIFNKIKESEEEYIRVYSTECREKNIDILLDER